jgi:Rrf2 family protein
MRISKRCEYALRALIDLGIARELGRDVLPVSRLAASEKIPARFLEQILAQLKAARYLRSVRGKRGGYGLRRPLASIVLGDVVRLMDGPLAPIPCVSQSAAQSCSCPDENHCGLRIVMMDVRTAISGILDRYTLANVVEVTLRKIRRDGVPAPVLEGMGLSPPGTPSGLKGTRSGRSRRIRQASGR